MTVKHLFTSAILSIDRGLVEPVPSIPFFTTDGH